MPRKGENIYKRKDGRWEGRFIKEYGSNGKAKYAYIYGKSYSEVKKKLTEYQCNQLLNENLDIQKTILYDEILSLWLTAVKHNVKESTYARYYQLITNHIRPALGAYCISKISSSLVESFVNRLLENGRLDGTGGLSPKTVSDILTLVKSTFEYAQYHGYTVTCKLSKIAIRKSDCTMRVLDDCERMLLETELLSDITPIKFGILLSLYTGIRIGELCALRWKYLKLEEQTLEVRETMQRIQNVTAVDGSKTRIIITTPKSKSSIRSIPIPYCILDTAQLFKCAPNAFVLTGKSGEYIEPRTVQNHFKRYVKASGIPMVNYHALRHTFATRCVELGFEIKSLSEILGHTNVNITLNRYVHSSFDLKRSNMNKLSFQSR